MSCLSPSQLAALPDSFRLLEIGCGPKKVWPKSVTLDYNPASRADVLHDLNAFPYPFDDNAFDSVLAEHVIEHLHDVVRVVEELHRITRPGGIVYVEVPHFSNRDFYTDPTHRHSFSITSFDYFVPAPGGLFTFSYSQTARFRRRRAAIGGPMGKWWQRIVHRLANKNPERFEREFTFIFPRHNLNFELEVLK